jgi:hypothetical protein
MSSNAYVKILFDVKIANYIKIHHSLGSCLHALERDRRRNRLRLQPANALGGRDPQGSEAEERLGKTYL